MADRKVLVISSWAPPLIEGSPSIMDNLLRFFTPDSYIILTRNELYSNKKRNADWLPVNYYFYGQKRQEKVKAIATPVAKSVTPIDMLRKKFNYFVTPFMEIWSIIKVGSSVIKIEKPTSILGLSEGGPMISTLFLSLFYRLPYSIFIMDLYADNLITSWSVKVIANFFEPIIFKNAKHLIVLNEGVKEFYEKKHSVSAEVVRNAFTGSIKEDNQFIKNDKFKIVFTGSIYWAQEEALLRLVKVVNKLPDVKLLIYTPQSKAQLETIGIKEKNNINISWVAPDKIGEVLSTADALFLPLSFNTVAPNLINTSVPAKFASYLVSGAPILVHAPRESFISKHCEKYEAGLVVSNPDENELKSAIIKLMKSREYCGNLVRHAKGLSKINYGLKENAEKLRRLLYE